MDYVIERTHIIDHERFLEAGVYARDLWEWGLKYSGKHETDGAIPMAAVLTSPWGYGGKANIRAAMKLVEVGLWERTDKGFQIKKWAEQGNKTRAQIEASREKWRSKKADQRKRDSSPPKEECPPGTPEGTPSGTLERVLNSPSYSLSGSDLQGGAGGARPEWADQAIEAAELGTGETFDRGVVWTKYQASRERDARAPSAPDFRSFLASWASRQKSDRVNQRARAGPGSQRQPLGDRNAKWLKTGSDL